MTKEIAINVLNQIKELILNSESWLESTHEPISQCFDMAIKALEQQLCDDCISRQEVINCVTSNEFRYKIVEDIKTLPSVTPKERTGHWVKTPKAVMGEGYMWYCDKCEHQVYQDSSRDYPSEKYCPNCGARMFEPQESEYKEGK